jgi:hypothetical protein
VVALDGAAVQGVHAIDVLERGVTVDEEDFVWRRIGVDGDGDAAAGFERADFLGLRKLQALRPGPTSTAALRPRPCR